MESNIQNDNSYINNEKNQSAIDDFQKDQSIRLDSIKEENMIEYNPHNYQCYFLNPQIVGSHYFVNEHNIIFKKNMKEIREELNNADEKRLEKSNNSIQINKIQDNNAENKVEKIDKSNKEEIKEIDNLNEKEDSKTKDQLNKKDVFNEQIPSSMKKKNVNTCCNIF